MRPLCPVDHDAAVANDAQWSTFTPIGIQESIDDDGKPEFLALANCPCCHTTRARLVSR